MRIFFKKLHCDAKIPAYQSDGASGFDLCCMKDEMVSAGETVLIPTGLSVQLPPYVEMQVRPRSGLALKTPYLVKNSPGTVDSDYRGDIGIIVHNLGKEPLFFDKGERIAQGVVVPVIHPEIFEVNELLETGRGTGGFGSTGTK